LNMRPYKVAVVLLFAGLTYGCTHSDPGYFVTYEFSGGIAGHAIVVALQDDGAVSLRDRARTASTMLNDQVLAELKVVCAQLPKTGLGKSVDDEVEIECCDQIIEQVTFQNRVYSLSELDEEFAATLRDYFRSIHKRGLAEDKSSSTSAGKETSVDTEASVDTEGEVH